MTVYYDPVEITETDIPSEGLYLLEELEEQEHDWEYYREVKECCGGQDWTCGHYRHYPELLRERHDW